ncbi:hypothetical protein JG688_00008039 [Phytophthora aleatoria]|uniref:Uncharacterized protein n=1 Tax=Phytophthora aleatoria TaxID=2496075 RepID=A0A8J5J572_9STRA|nr:hypothetical protein JG688_00008039 [Phytophthora aleatoria]
MHNSLRSRIVATAVSCMALALPSSIGLASAEDLCSIPPYSYTGAKADHPELTTAIETLENYAIASWFTDRQTADERSTMITNMLNQCSEDTRLSIVVYGCGGSAGYLDNLKVAVAALSANANAELYIDIGYWILVYPDSASKVATAMKDIGTSGRVKGVTINTSNYRSNDECAGYCTNFQTAMGSTDMKCIVDTSRNYNGSPTSDWCNVPTAGIGKPPTSETGVSNVDYFMWIKPPGESDGECPTGGTSAGSFYLEGFTLLWDQGYFVSEQGMPKIGDGSTPTTYAPSSSADSSSQSNSDQTTSTPTPAPTTDNSSWSQDQTVGTVAPADTTWTEAPEAAAASTTSPVIDTTAPPCTTMPATTTTPSTTVPAAKTESTTQFIACKAKKRLRSL